jgi:hypothetical protein
MAGISEFGKTRDQPGSEHEGTQEGTTEGNNKKRP